MTGLEVSTGRDDHGGVVTVSVRGELDLASVGQLRAEVERELDRADCTGVRIDLSGLTFLDSTGSGCLVALRNHADDVSKSLLVQSVPASLMRVLTIGGLAYLTEDGAAGASG